MLPVDIQVPVPGSYSSALGVPLKHGVTVQPPATRTFPFVSSVAVKATRPKFMLPVGVHVPGVCAGASWRASPDTETGFPNEFVTDLLNPATARRVPIEQRIRPSTTRGMKKAEREVEFVFIRRIS